MVATVRRWLTPIVTVAAIASVWGQTLPAWSQYIPRSDIGRAANRQGAGTRGDCWHAQDPTLTALTPVSNLSWTTSAYPTFYWFRPANNYPQAEFLLFEDGVEAPIYQAPIQNPGDSGIQEFNLSNAANAAPLKVGTDYRWVLKLICDPAEPSAVYFAEGWIHRLTPDAEFVSRLQGATPIERYQIYAESGLWYDALKALVTLRQAHPHDPSLEYRWQSLLESQDLKLGGIVQKPVTEDFF